MLDEYDIKDAFKAIAELRGILLGISMDEEISSGEHEALLRWVDANKDLENVALMQLIGMIRGVLSDGAINTEEYAYLMRVCDVFTDSSTYRRQTIAEQQLKGIVEGITADDDLSPDEMDGLRRWVIDNQDDLDSPLVDAIISLIDKIIKKGKMSSDASEKLNDLLSKMIDPVQDLRPEITFEGKNFCLTGNFAHGSKGQIENDVRLCGGNVLSRVTKLCDYVIVGGEGSPDYAFGNYGTKVKRALVLQQEGQDIKIISEEVLFAEMEKLEKALDGQAQ